LALVAALVTGATFAAEQEPMSTDRPDFLTSPSVVGKGRYQIEIGPFIERTDTADLRTRTVTVPTLVRIGVSDSLELRVETESYNRVRETELETQMTTRTSGWADGTLGVKWAMRKGDADSGAPAIGWVLQAAVPSGSAALRGRGVRPALIGAFEWELANEFGVAASAGVTYDNTGEGERFASGLLGAGISKGVTDRLTLAAEIVATQIARGKYGGSVTVADVSATYALTGDVQLDALVGRKVSSDGPKYFFTVGVSLRF
jgi:hypothetical protein